MTEYEDMARLSSQRRKLEELEAKKAQIEARIKKEKARIGEQERKADNHAKIVIGGMVLACFEGDWKSVDFSRLQEYLNKYGYAIAKNTCGELPTPEASKRLKNWERGGAWE